MVLKVAITGNIAAGKSQVEKTLVDIGYPVYDTDKIAHEILNHIKDFYGYDVLTDGKIDRKKLAKIVFNDKEAMQKLENIVHPKVKEKICQLFEQHKNDNIIFVSVPQLYEAGFETIFDKVILIFTDDELRKERLKIRNNLTDEECVKRINAQLSQEKKTKLADYIIYNNADLSSLKEQVIKVLNSLI